MRVALLSAGLLCALACGAPMLPPYGQALLVVDTDAIVPAFAGRLRVDLYGDDGSWVSSRDVARRDTKDWPASFTLYNPSDTAAHTALVRLRVYPEGKTREYRGERFEPRPDGDPKDVTTVPAPDGMTPRLLDKGVDVTPPFEPLPLLTIDRLVRIRLDPTITGAVHVMMHGSCFGTMADLARRTTCVDTENERKPVGMATIDPDRTIPPTAAGTFGKTIPCNAPLRPASKDASGGSLFDEEVCIDGGGYIFGNADNFGNVFDIPQTDELHYGNAVPEHIAVLSPFRMDKYEVTVGRWRDAVARGFASPFDPLVNDGDIDPSLDPNESPPGLCTYSTKPRGRENYAINCLDVDGARAFCMFEGGDLITEAQWEYVAQKLDRDHKTKWPWGDDFPTCASAVYGRSPNVFDNECTNLGKGPRAEDDPHSDVGARGIVNLGGGMGEWVSDAFHAFESNCWAQASLVDPQCTDDAATWRSVRGGTWAAPITSLYAGHHAGIYPGRDSNTSFRCARGVP